MKDSGIKHDGSGAIYGVLGGGLDVPGIVKNEAVGVVVVLIVVLVEADECPGVAELLPPALTLALVVVVAGEGVDTEAVEVPVVDG